MKVLPSKTSTIIICTANPAFVGRLVWMESTNSLLVKGGITDDKLTNSVL